MYKSVKDSMFKNTFSYLLKLQNCDLSKSYDYEHSDMYQNIV